MKTLVIDSNQIVNTDWRLNNSMWRLLRGMSRTGQIRLVVPEVVVAEAVGAFSRQFVEVNAGLKLLGIPLNGDQAAGDYESDLRASLHSCNASVLPDDHISISELVKRATARTVPIDENGNGFRDTVVWARVLQLASSGDEVVLITNDHDFCGGTKTGRYLHPDLVSEADLHGNIVWYNSIEAFVESSGRDSDLAEVESAILELIASDREQVDINLAEAIAQGSVDVLGRKSAAASTTRVLLPIEIQEASVNQIPDQQGQFAVVLRLAATLVLDVDTTAGESTSQRQKNVKVAAERISVEAIYDSSDGVLDQFSGASVELDWSALTDSMNNQSSLRRFLADRWPPSDDTVETLRSFIQAMVALQAATSDDLRLGTGVEQSESMQKLVETFMLAQAKIGGELLEASGEEAVEQTRGTDRGEVDD